MISPSQDQTFFMWVVGVEVLDRCGAGASGDVALEMPTHSNSLFDTKQSQCGRPDRSMGNAAADFFNADALIAPEITREPCGYYNGQFLWGKFGRREWCCAVLVHIFGCAIAAPQARRAAMKCLDAKSFLDWSML